MKRIAVIFDIQPRPETTGLYVRRALGELVHEGRVELVEHLLPSELERVSPDQFDLFLYVDDGMQNTIREDLRPAVWWGIDSHLEFERCLKMASLCDVAFTAQRDGAARLHREGIKTAQWLPLACDPQIHGQVQASRRFDVAFVGHIFPGKRQELLSQIAARYPNSFIGQKNYLEMKETYSGSRVVFNRSLRNDINMRVFEGLCSGSLLVTNDLAANGQDQLIQEGVHYASYNDAEELFDKLDYYLKHDEIRERMASTGRQHVLQHHTYRHRVESLLNSVQQQLSASPTSVPLTQPILQSNLPQKEEFYFEFDRPDVQAMVPSTAKRILDIGCGGGRLGEALKQRQQCEVIGIERDPVAAERANQRLDHVLQGDITTDEIEFPEDSFDCVICADVLEHLRNPEAVLKKIRHWLKPDGQLITSLPNVRNHTVVRSLLAGNWTYEPAGLLDEDHVRFFTRREIEKLLFRTGFEIDEMRAVGGDGYQNWVEQGRSLQLSIGPFQLRAGSVEEAEEFFAYQYLAKSSPSQKPQHALTSIVIVTHNQLSYTKECLESIRMRTTAPYELIVIDNGSTDRTVDYLRGCADVRLLENHENRGFPTAANQGIEIATGENILLLNNDTLVTTGWLTRMLTALHSSDEIGLVGPLSNNISGSQQIEVSYDDLAQLDGFAWDLGKRQRNVHLETDRLVGFCLLFKKELVEKIGLLDEQFGIGNFEDDDYCRRAADAGYKRLIATDSFVHHFGSVTFKANGVDFGGLLKQNQQLYEQKWNPQASSTSESPSQSLKPTHPQSQHRSPRPKFLFDKTEDGALLLRENNVHLSACLIVRDNAQTIRPCLETLIPWVDEVVIVDTGSTDETPQICEDLGCRVYHWAWRDDFAAARNESLKYARGDWIFWMDSDDTLPEECGRQLRQLADSDHKPETFGYVMQVHCPGQEPTDITVVDHIKLFRNRPDLNFEFRIHEQILPSIRRAGGNVEFTDLYVVHSGATRDTAGKQHKLERDFKLLHLELQDRPNHPFTLFNLGMTYADCGQHQRAVNHLQQCINVSGAGESHVRKAYALLTNSLNQIGNEQAALQTCQVALDQFPGDKELLFRRAMLEHQTSQLEAAIATYHQVLEETTDRHFTSVDLGICFHKAKYNLASIYQEQRAYAKSALLLNEVINHTPGFAPAWRSLANIVVREGASVLPTDLVSRLESAEETPELDFLRSRIAMTADRIDESISICRRIHEHDPLNPIKLNDYCELLFLHADAEIACEMLTKLTELEPNNASAWLNLATTQMREGKLDDALSSATKSLDLRPKNTSALSLLKEIQERNTVLLQT